MGEVHEAVAEVDLDRRPGARSRRSRTLPVALDDRHRADRVGVVQELAQRDDDRVELADRRDEVDRLLLLAAHAAARSIRPATMSPHGAPAATARTRAALAAQSYSTRRRSIVPSSCSSA